MKALILAAGFGSRLAPLTDNLPKSLVAVNGTPILFKQIDNLLKNGISDITVVSGYKADILKERVHQKYPNVAIIESKNYATTNNMFSAYLGIKHIGTDGFLMMNADVFFDGSVISSLLSWKSDNAIVVDKGSYSDESMKVVCENGRVVSISKQIERNKALGNSIDVYKFGANGAKEFLKKCIEYIEEKKILNKWSEVALDEILSTVRFEACPLDGRWFEIDNLEDLKAAEELFSK